ncbi:adenosine deaminase [Spirochaeta cellobiosiphila]|uniref:adenosine deaminase n=1 Tax=Spirochaeta cellobiosiphila TaxID=504483 RepID=UPI000408C072|nr:adenosine deaminase [Spirochaeta cellobiosiphila]
MIDNRVEERDKERLMDFLSRVSKTEIHIHAEMTVRPETYLELNKKYQLESAMNTVDDFAQYLKISSLSEMIQHFFHLQTFFKEPEDFKLMARDVLHYAKSNQIFYMEVFVSPSKALQNGIDFNQMMQALETEFEIIEQEAGVRILMLLDVSRSFGPENANNNLELLIGYNKKISSCHRCIGIGLGGAEEGNPARDYKKVFQKARRAGLHVVSHAGEEVESESIWEAIKDLKSERIGHGTSAIKDEKLMEYLKKKQIPLEICPTSNVITGKYVKEMGSHPIKKFFRSELMVTINTDDPLLFDVQLNDEYYNLYKHLNLSVKDIAILIENNLKATFLKKREKDILLQRMKEQVKNASLTVWGRTL